MSQSFCAFCGRHHKPPHTVAQGVSGSPPHDNLALCEGDPGYDEALRAAKAGNLANWGYDPRDPKQVAFHRKHLQESRKQTRAMRRAIEKALESGWRTAPTLCSMGGQWRLVRKNGQPK